jgi:hypothetical protein
MSSSIYGHAREPKMWSKWIFCLKQFKAEELKGSIRRENVCQSEMSFPSLGTRSSSSSPCGAGLRRDQGLKVVVILYPCHFRNLFDRTLFLSFAIYVLGADSVTCIL